MVATPLCPETVADLVDAIRDSGRVCISGADRHRAWRVDEECGATPVHLRKLAGIVSIEPADQVAVVRAGATVSEVQAALAEAGQALPYAPFEEGDDPTIGGALSLALPHRLEGRCGTWRDWTLGMTVVRPDGSVAKCGSHAVKNVAGYDVARLFIGARGALGVIAEVILRTYPLKALPAPPCPALVASVGPRWVQRTPLRFASQLRGGTVDLATATLWTDLPAEEALPRFSDDWVVRSGCQAGNLEAIRHPELHQRARARFDPEGKLNPGAFGE